MQIPILPFGSIIIGQVTVVASAVSLQIIDKKQRLPIPDIVFAATGTPGVSSPKWFPKKTELKGYDDSWQDWSNVEIECLKDRLNMGVSPEIVLAVFRPTDFAMGVVNWEVYGQKDVQEAPVDDTVEPEPQYSPEVEKHSVGEFDFMDIPDVRDRAFANRRWVEYAQRLDIEKPQNQTLLRSIITLETQMRRVAREINSDDEKERSDALQIFPRMQKQFSDAASDLSLLEKQFKDKDEWENLDDFIHRTHDVRTNWRDVQIENELAMHGLYDLHEKMHKKRF